MEVKTVLKQGKAARQVPKTTLDVTVLMGGPSAERDVSLVSGAAIATALGRLGHKVVQCDISPSETSALDRQGIDLVFIALHGEFGESGEAQDLCEGRGLRYIGSGPRASALAMDKVAAKEMFRLAGLDTPPWVVVERSHQPEQRRQLLASIGAPAVVKPVNGGSSVDVTIARRQQEMDQAVDALVERHDRALVEKFIPGREFTVGILGSEALPPIEVVPAREFYDYTAKYADGSGTQYVFDHGLDAGCVNALKQAALRAHGSLGCRDLSRVDFILDDAGAAQVLEINTIPGFTGHSLLPMAAARVGLGFDQLVDRIVSMAMARPAPGGS